MLRFSTLLTFLFCSACLFAQHSPIEHAKIRVGFHAKIKAAAAYDVRLESYSGSAAPFPNQTYTNYAGLNALASTPDVAVLVVPGQRYRLTVSCSSWKWADLQFNAPPGYSVKLGVSAQPRTSRTTYRTPDFNGASGTSQIDIAFEPNDGAASLRPGYANAPSVGNVLWSIGLGATRNGQSVGVIRWRETSVTDDLLDAASLIYSEAFDSDVYVSRDSQQRISAISTWAVQVVVRPGTTPKSGYTIECYEPGATLTAHTGFREYVISNPDSTWNNRVKIAVTTRSTGNPTVTDSWTLSQQGTLTMIDQGNAARRLRLVSRAGPGTDVRSEVATLDAGTGTAIVSRTRRVYKLLFKTTPWEREELLQEIADPSEYFNDSGTDETNSAGLNLTTDYLYFEDPAKTGSYTKLQSVTRSDGSRESYKYYGDAINDAADASKWGQLAAIYRPWRDDMSASSTTANDNNCKAAIFDYSGERDVYKELLSRQETKILGVTAALTETAYAFGTAYTRYPTSSSSQSLRIETITSTAESGRTLTTTRKVFSSSADACLAGRLYSQVNPDGTALSMAYHRYGSGSNLLEETISGTATKPTADAIQLLYGSYNYNSSSGPMIEPIWVVPWKSQSRRVLRDFSGRLLTDGVAVGNLGGTGAPFIECKSYTYSNKGELIQIDTLKGEQTFSAYTNGQVSLETQTDGTQVQKSYDEFQRLSQTTLKGVAAGSYPAQPDVVTTYTYDAANRVISTKRAAGGLELTTSISYNLAGLPNTKTDERNLSTSYAYADGGRTVTVTLPGGAIKIETRYRDGSPKSETGSAAPNAYHATTRNSDGTLTNTDYLLRASDLAAIQGATTTTLAGVLNAIPRRTSVTTDWLGQKLREERPSATGTPFAKQYFYDAQGRLSKAIEPNLADSRYTYNNLGEPEFSGLDINGSQSLTLDSTDRVQQIKTIYQLYSSAGAGTGGVTLKTQTFGYNQTGNATPYQSSEGQQELVPYGLTSPDGTSFFALPGQNTANTTSELRTLGTDLFGNLTVSSHIFSRSTGIVTAKVKRPDSSVPELVVSRNGLVQSRQTAQGLVTTYHYDALRRVVEEIDPRYGSAHPIKTAYYTTNSGAAGTYAIYTSVNGANGQVAWRKDAAGNQTTYTYSATDGRMLSEVNALNKAVYTSYNLRGQVLRQWGPATYPVEYEYDDYGERAKMSTFRTAITAHTTDAWGSTTYPSTTGDTTTWAYDAATGLLVSKTDAAPKTVTYTYDIRGNLKTRTWARNVVTTYTYSSVTGEQTAISYSDGTPGLVYDYNRLGQNTSVVQGTGGGTLTSLFARCICGKVTRETLDPTFFGNQVLTYKLDTTGTGTNGRTVGYQLGVADNYALHADYSYGYDDYGRFSTLGLDNESIPYTYSYLEGSNLIASVTGSAAVQYFTYESYRDHLTDVTTVAAGAISARVSYVVDALGRRTSAVNEGEIFSRYSGGGHHTLYAYNDRSEVTSAQTWTGLSLSDTSTPSALGGRKFDFAFDPIGNRVTSKVDNRQTDYTTNALNQYSSRTVPRAVDVNGLASGPGSVTVNGSAATRVGDYFSSTITAGSNSASWLTATVAATPGGTQNRTVYVPPAPEANTYDDDGNLTADGRWTYTWDAENRLTSMETSIAAYTAGAPRQFLSFKYDYLGRRIRKTVANWNGSGYVTAADWKFIYDGWNLIAEYDVLTTFTMVRTYVWALDISRTLADAGGVKGLLLIRDWATGQSHQTIYDGNGNLLGLVQRSTGAITAQYEYSPFGETIRATGSYAASNPFRFSTKFTDAETGLVYYGQRYYEPKQGRFVGRDPIEEKGGLHLYGFCGNNGVNRWDVLGMDPWSSWFVKDNGDGTFTGSAQRLYATDLPDTVEGALVNMGSWNFSSEADAASWAQQRARGIVDDRGNPTFTRFVRGWDQREADNLIDSEYWGGYSWNRFNEWKDAEGVRSTFENPGFPMQGSAWANIAAADAYGSALIDAYYAANPGGGFEVGSDLRTLFGLVGKIWALPNTAIGFTIGMVGVPFGATAQFGDNSIQFLNFPVGNRSGGGFTLGNAQIYHNAGPVLDWVPRYDDSAFVNLGRHEQGHSSQAQILGPFFIPVYVAGAFVGIFSGGNPLENGADNYAARVGSFYPIVKPLPGK